MIPTIAAVAVAALLAPLLATARATAADAPVTASHAAAIRGLIELTGALDREVARVDVVVAGLRGTAPDLPDAVWENYAARLRDREQLLARYVPVYARHLDEADVRALAAFYASPLGARVLVAQTAIAEDSRVAGEKLVAAVLAEGLDDGGDAGAPGDPPDVRAGPAAIDPSRATTGTDADAVDPAHAAAVRELLEAMHALPAAQEAMRRTVDTLRAAPALRDVPTATWDRLVARLTDEAALLDLWVPAYARHLPEDDVRALAAFYRTPLGTRIARALPAIQADLAVVAQRYGAESARRAIREVMGPLPQWRPRTAPPPAPAPAPAPRPPTAASPAG